MMELLRWDSDRSTSNGRTVKPAVAPPTADWRDRTNCHAINGVTNGEMDREIRNGLAEIEMDRRIRSEDSERTGGFRDCRIDS